jgi:uncharacterized repeat protein (TIGR01451 family)
MKTRNQPSFRLYMWFALTGLLLLSLWPSLVAAMPLTAKHHLERAWLLAAEVGRFEYRTDVTQTTHPTNRLENAGRSAITQHLFAKGMVDRPGKTMQLKLAQPGSGNRALELKVEGGQAFGRINATAEWTEIPNPTDIFAPGGDPLGFLVAAENVRESANEQMGEWANDGDNILIHKFAYSHIRIFSFDINSPRYAEYMRTQLEGAMRERGELPPGVTLDLIRQFAGMTGHGQIWVNDGGLPVYQVIHLEFPPEKGGLNWVEADITTDFSGWTQPANSLEQGIPILARLGQNLAQLIKDPFSLLPTPYSLLPTPDHLQTFGLLFGLSLLLAAFIIMAITHRRSLKFYGALVAIVMIAMLVTPLLQANTVYAFTTRQQAKQAEFDRQQQTQQAAAEGQAELSGRNFNPTVNPLGDNYPLPITHYPLQPTGDATRNSPSLLPHFQGCDLTAGEADCDGDGLSNFIELAKLGTDPAEVDTDGDRISDAGEVGGFNNGSQWYLDPLSPDSNGDRASDGGECPELVDIDDNGALTSPSGSVCTNTDTDNTPDVFDFDDDGDGVPDAVDSTPAYRGSLTTNPQSQIDLDLSGYATGQPIFVEFELRPTDPAQLWYVNNVLDWPGDDTEGQVTRVHDTTFFSAGSYDSDMPKIDNGDIMLTPLLEIRIAGPDSNLANPSGSLPLASGFSGSITNQTDLATWLDQERLAEFGINVSQDPDSGELYAYVPLGMIKDEVGDTPVAWGAQMVYQPQYAAWGAAHQARLVWMVTALVDNCVTSDMPATFTYTDANGNAQTISRDDDNAYELWCQNEENWDTSSTIVQSYYEDFYLTGLVVRQESEAKSALIAQANATSVNYPDYLWHLMNGLQNTFVPGHLVDSNNDNIGDYRFDIDEIVRRFGGNTFGNGAPELWGIPNGTLTVVTDSAPDRVTNVKRLVETQIPALLDSTYGSTSGVPVTLLTVREERFKALNLAFSYAITMQGSSISADLSGVDEEVYGSVHWAPYGYDGFGWVGLDLVDYLETLEANAGAELTDADLQTILGSEPLQDTDLVRRGAISLAKNFYLAVHRGLASPLEVSGTPIRQTVVDDALFALGGQKPLALIISQLVQSAQTFFQEEAIITVDGELLANNLNSANIEKREILATMGVLEFKLEGLDGVSEAALEAGISLGETLYKKIYKKLYAIESISNFHSKLGSYGATTLALASAGILFLYETKGVLSKQEAYITAASLTAGSAIFELYGAIAIFNNYGEFARGVFQSERLAAVENARMTKTGAIIGAVVDVSIIVGLMIYQTISQGIEFGSLAFSQLLAQTIAQVIVTIILAVLSATFVGSIVVAVLELIDAVLALVCALTDWDKDANLNRWVCGGITGAITQALTYLIFDQYALVDLRHKNRLNITFYEPSITPTSGVEGYVVGNEFQTSALVTSTLKLNKPTGIGSGVNYLLNSLGLNNLDQLMRQSTFTYTLQSSQTGHHSGLSQNQLNWSNNTKTFDISGSGSLVQAGINQGIDFYLTESFNMPVLECWGFIAQKCVVRSFKESYHTDLGQSFIFDILPNSLAGFTNLAFVSDGSYRLSWDEQFPILKDADGDGLRSKAAGGPDPDDSKWDSDGDGLSDFWELDNDFEPGDFDPDGDGLSDYWESFYLTDPFIADSDYDGLLDGQEFFHSGTPNPYQADNSTWSGGWDFVYTYNASDQPLTFRVSSDPLAYDSEDDGISDYLEFVYGYNPGLPSKLNVLSLDTSLAAPWLAGEMGYIYPGGAIPYTATIKNELDNRTANGLLEAEFPVDVVQQTQVFGGLGPQQETSLSGSVTAPAVAQTQAQSVTLRAGAVIEAPAPPDTSGLVYHNPLETPLEPRHGIRGVGADGVAPDEYFTNFSLTGNDAAFSVSVWLQPQVGPGEVGVNYDMGILRLEFYDLEMSVTDQFTMTIGGDQICPDIKLGNFFTNADKFQWRHVVLVYDGVGTYRVYRNSNLVNSTASTCPNPNLSNIRNVTVGSEINDPDIWGFPGVIDEIRAYDKALSVDEVKALFKNTTRTLDLAVDEPPGQSSFADDSPSDFGATCSGNTCPDSGLPGLSNQSLRFDGSNDFATVNATAEKLGFTKAAGALYDQGSFTAMAWVKPDNLGQTRSVIQVRNGGSNNFLDMGVNNLGQAYLIRSSGGSFLTSATTLPAGQWSHVAWQYAYRWQSGKWDQVIYVNGQEEARRSGQLSFDDGAASVFLGKAGHHGQTFAGLLDEIIIANATLSEAEIQAIMQETPLLSLHLDEGLADIGQTSSSAFGDASPYGNDATCTTNCPSAGAKGKMREAPVFEGSELLTVTPGSELNLNHFSLSMWVKPGQVKDGVQELLRKTNGSGAANYRLRTLTNSLRFRFELNTDCTSGGLRDLNSNGRLVQDQWNHIVVTYDGQTQKIYLNGSLDRSKTWGSAANPCISGSNLNLGQNFDGSLDEVLIYGSALDSLEVADLYDYQAAWYDDTLSKQVIIDADDPALSVEVFSDYLPNAPTQIAFTARDIGSQIDRVEITITPPSGGPSTTSVDPDSATFTFSPSGPGQYSLQLTGWDVVGHSASSPIKTVYVDDTSPTATLAASLTGSTLPVSDNLLLSGTVSDSGPAGGSGVATNTVAIDVQAWQGASINGSRNAASDGSNWQVDYPFTTPPYGPYTVQANLADTTGNVFSGTLGAISLDGLGPVADVGIGQVITGGNTTIAGTAGDIPTPIEGRALALHFEEPAGSAIFVDSSRNQFSATCSGSDCPTAGQSGQHGSAVSFDGSNDTLLIKKDEGLELDGGTLLAWVRPGWSSGANGYNPTVLRMNGRYSLALGDDYGSLILSNGTQSQTIPANLSANQWQHLAVTINGDQWTAYLDGVALGTITQTIGGAIGQPLHIGSADGSDHFDGLIDELLIYNNVLDANTIYNIANPLDTAVASAQLRLRHLQEGDLGEDGGAWINLSLASTADNFTIWQYTVPEGLEGSYKIDLKATDELGNNSYIPNAWSGDIDLLAPRLALTYTLITDNYAYVGCYAEDYSITTANLVCPGSGPVEMPETADWFVTFFSPLTRATAISVPLQAVIPTTNTLTACDLFGQCTTTSITNPTYLAEMSAILTPSHTARHLGLEPVTIEGLVRSPDGVQSVEVMVDGQSIYSTTFTGGLTETTWTTANWTPTRWGDYNLQATLTNGLSQQIPSIGQTTLTVVAPELTLTKTASPDTLLDTGDTLTYTLTVANSGNGDALGVVVTDALPAEVSGTNLETTVNISAFDSVNLTIPVTVLRAFTPTITNTGYFSHTYQQGQGSGGFSVCHYHLVTNANDSGPGSLRQAIAEACDAALITFAGDFDIYLDSVLTLNKELTIDGSSHEIVISGDSGNDGDRDVQVFAVQPSGIITLTHLNVVSGTGNLGGGIYNQGRLTVLSSTLHSNLSPASGTGVGGGIYNENNLTVKNSQISKNEAGRDGGGIYHISGQLLVESSVISGNISGRQGGGIYLSSVASSDSRIIRQSALLNNVAATEGGGLVNGNATTLANNTIAGNLAQDGAAIYNLSVGGLLTLNNTTVATNTASSGAAVKSTLGGKLNISNSIIANNEANAECTGQGESDDTVTNSLIEDGSCAAPFSGDPLLSAVGDYGGSTPSLGLLPGSPVLDAGDPATCEPVDQRGVARPFGAACDLGAFESQGFNLTITGGNNQTIDPNTTFAQPLTVTVIAAVSPEPVGAGGVISFTGPGSGPGLAQPIYTTTLGSDGTAGVVVTANQLAGSYPVTATLRGAITPALFSLTNACVGSYTVANNNDDGEGSLRRGISNICAGGVITFANSYTISLNSPLTINKALTIDGAGHTIKISGDSNGDGAPDLSLFQIGSSSVVTLTQLNLISGTGAIINQGTLLTERTTLAGHTAAALENSGIAWVSNSTFSGNGQHISNTLALTLTNNTLAHSSGAGVVNSNSLAMQNNIIAYSAGSDCVNNGTLTANINNLIEDNSCSPALAGDPVLSTLDSFGSSTSIHALLPGSPAIDAGNPLACGPSDQRGVSRPQGSVCDIGAFESGGFTLAYTGGNNQYTSLNSAFGSPLQVTVTANVSTEPVGPDGLISYTGPASGAGLNGAGLTAPTDSSGVAGLVAIANSITGSYVVTATALGASDGVTFSLENRDCFNAQVTNANDSGDGSLRQTIADACAGANITFAANFAITLNSSLSVNKELTISGAGRNIILSGDSGANGDRNVRVWNIQSEAMVTLTHLTVVSSTGSALYNNGQVTVIGSAFVDNQGGQGGAFYNQGTATVANSTFSGNHATGQGGAIYNRGSLTSINNTIANNSSPIFGGLDSAAGATLAMTNTLIYGNSGIQCRTSSLLSADNNLIGETNLNCGPAIQANPQLSDLGSYGGNTPVHALQLTSAALDAGAGAGCSSALVAGVDQRGMPRGTACDIGAFEGHFNLAVSGGNQQTGLAGALFAEPLAVTVSTPNGEPLGSNGVLIFNGPATGPGLNGAYIVGVAPGGLSTVTVRANQQYGSYVVTATTTGVITPANFVLTNTNAAPVITPTAFSVSESAAVDTAVGVVEANDPNGTELTYSITGGNTGSAFAIGATGQITIAAALDYETTGQYLLTVAASDGLLTGTTTITVNINDETADLVVQKTANPAEPNLGQPITYTITFSNTGGDTATGVVLTDIVPAEVADLTYQASGDVGVALTRTTGITYEWMVSDLLSGQGGVITISGQLPTSLTAGIFTNTVVISGASPESNIANNQAQVAVTACANALTVTNGNDSGAGSLRWAVASICDGGAIAFAGDFTIILSSRLEIEKGMTIDGSGHEVTISGNDSVQAFFVASDSVVTLSQLNVVNGYADPLGESEGKGGAVQVASNGTALTVINSTFSNNKADSGGAIFADFFTPVAIVGSSFTDNSATYGGAVLTIGPLTVTNSVFSGNQADSSGGAISSEASAPDAVTITGSLFKDNQASDGVGGAIVNYTPLTVTNSTFYNNTATGDDGGFRGRGGAIFNFGQAVINNVTFVSNTATFDGSTLYNAVGESGAEMTLRNSLVAGSSAIDHCAESLTGGSNYLIEDGSCNPTLATDPRLAPLGSYGGQTQTFALLPGSPTINAGDNATCETLDQRGVTRSSPCDLGAFESSGFSLTITGGNNQSTAVNTAFANPLEVALAANAAIEPIGTGVIISFTAPYSGTGLTTTGFTATTNNAGVVLTTVTANAIEGSYPVTATIHGISPAIFTLTNIMPDTTPPDITNMTLITPTNGITVTGRRPIFDWSDASDTQSGVISYTLFIVSSNDSINIQEASTTITTTQSTFMPVIDLDNGVYTWTVRAHDAAGNVSAWVSPAASFTIEANSTRVYLPVVRKGSK